jgi:putative glutamine amidotransferase
MNKPIIALTSQYTNDDLKMATKARYFKAIELAGGLPIALPQTDNTADILQYAQLFDGYLLTGGDDINPKYYGEEIMPECGFISDTRDFFEITLFRELVKLNKPVLGICRGIQVMNAALGGSLYQHYEEHQNVRHDIYIDVKSRLYKLYEAGRINVNSYHHQAVKKLSGVFSIAAVDKDGLIEAVCIENNKYIVGVQWHPEIFDEDNTLSVKLFNDFITNCL